MGRGGWTETLSGHFSWPETPTLRGAHISQVQGRGIVLWEKLAIFLTWRGWAIYTPHCPWVQLLSILFPCSLSTCAFLLHALLCWDYQVPPPPVPNFIPSSSHGTLVLFIFEYSSLSFCHCHCPASFPLCGFTFKFFTAEEKRTDMLWDQTDLDWVFDFVT